MYFDSKFAIVSVSEAEILDYTDFDVMAILKIQDGRHENRVMHYSML